MKYVKYFVFYHGKQQLFELFLLVHLKHSDSIFLYYSEMWIIQEAIKFDGVLAIKVDKQLIIYELTRPRCATIILLRGNI